MKKTLDRPSRPSKQARLLIPYRQMFLTHIGYQFAKDAAPNKSSWTNSPTISYSKKVSTKFCTYTTHLGRQSFCIV